MSTETLPSQAENSIGLEQAIQEFVQIEARLHELYQRKKEILAVLVPAANELREQRTNTTRLDSYDQSIQLKVEFKANIKADSQRLNTVKDLLGDDFFEDIFKTEYKPKLRFLKPFLASKSTDERLETAKTIIKESLSVTELPQITIEKGRIVI